MAATNSSGLPSVAELNSTLKQLIGKSVAKPAGATLAGHASGLPFEDLIHNCLSDAFPKRVLRQYEALNKNLLDNPGVTDIDERISLLGPESLQYLLRRGRAQMKNWSPDNLFVVKQDDTAETIIFADKDCDFSKGPVLLIDVKTQDIEKKAQAPNIMSADKLAHAAVLALKNGNYVPFEIIYTGVKWRKSGEKLICEDVKAISMMKITPPLYINWVAAQQIQFHPFDVDQSYRGSSEEWCVDYISNFCKSLSEKIEKEKERLKYFRAALN
jgi:Restriction endonuclease HincII